MHTSLELNHSLVNLRAVSSPVAHYKITNTKNRAPDSLEIILESWDESKEISVVYLFFYIYSCFRKYEGRDSEIRSRSNAPYLISNDREKSIPKQIPRNVWYMKIKRPINFIKNTFLINVNRNKVFLWWVLNALRWKFIKNRRRK